MLTVKKHRPNRKRKASKTRVLPRLSNSVEGCKNQKIRIGGAYAPPKFILSYYYLVFFAAGFLAAGLAVVFAVAFAAGFFAAGFFAAGFAAAFFAAGFAGST